MREQMINWTPVRDRPGALGVAERPVTMMKPGNAGGGRSLSSRPTYMVGDPEIGQPSNSEECSETADGVDVKAKAEAG